ncbi:MAG: hypothetical protein ACR2H4_20080 [Pyrinomonadaceae bacterium]
MNAKQRSFSDDQLETLQRLTFDYFLKETNPQNGLAPDSTRQGSPCSITATGFALAAYPVGVERKFITRKDAIKRTLTTCAFFGTVRMGRKQTPPATKVSIITSST